MASVEDLSDIELRKKLIEHGFEVGPVTGTTRKLLEKKLTALMSQKGKPTKTPAAPPKYDRSLSRFSSAEEDSDDALGNSRRKSMPAPANTKRKSMGRSARAAEAAAAATRDAQVADNLLMPSPPPPAPVAAPPARPRYSVNEAALRKNATPIPAATPPRNTRKTIVTSSPLRHPVKNGFESGSDSDVPGVVGPSPSIRSVRLSPSTRRSQVQDDVSQEEDDDDEEDKPIAILLSNLSDRFLPNSESSRRASPDSSNDYVNKRRMNIAKDASPGDSVDAPYLSAFARRLSQLRPHSMGEILKKFGHCLNNLIYLFLIPVNFFLYCAYRIWIQNP